MNSFSTNEKTLELLKQYPDILSDLPSTFIQHKYPKVLQGTLQPAQWPKDPRHEWNPPGHGDIYPALVTSGILQKLLDSGIKYAFVSNIDNLGATMDTSLLGYFAAHNFPFMMEVVERTEMDKKGGHLARLEKDNRLILREQAQAPENEISLFQDIKRYRYFNSNNIWINLEYLQKVFQNPEEPFQLPLIVNKKHLDPKDKSTSKVFQLETAMGAAISLFPNSKAVIITGKRYKPVKKCNNLFILWSDYCLLTENYELIQNPKRSLPPINVTLDEKYYGKYDFMKKRFPSGVPSLVDCKSLTIEGDLLFEGGVKITGDVRITNTSDKQVVIPDGTVIENDINY
jgi:UTP--glucose-1-phosphate uridylyltransferase